MGKLKNFDKYISDNSMPEGTLVDVTHQITYPIPCGFQYERFFNENFSSSNITITPFKEYIYIIVHDNKKVNEYTICYTSHKKNLI